MSVSSWPVRPIVNPVWSPRRRDRPADKSIHLHPNLDGELAVTLATAQDVMPAAVAHVMCARPSLMVWAVAELNVVTVVPICLQRR